MGCSISYNYGKDGMIKTPGLELIIPSEGLVPVTDQNSWRGGVFIDIVEALQGVLNIGLGFCKTE